ncbi:DUF389 domain-containing protein [Flavobacterium jejuense]|uniref:DUF389 domain-containing protein n=1 Tax=Flavobacterium jejuense TaxID=1544455 RepID=A0ABX0IWR4_9FLAO|nr:DUF389 domain-containing protein [Flavobacterium jejuense]NHN27207.1 DUF389 domain-containing protein [Flavobacterium jejuense]
MEGNNNSFGDLSKRIKLFLRGIFDISTDTDRLATIEDIKSGIDMKGQNAWILIFSILIASTGLNVSSTAVVIGAMLISPLMGPILGMGLSLGINDLDLLRKSLKNFGVMVVLSLTTSFLFFSIPLFKNETPELLARTAPNVLDVIIALSGGLALIIALSRRNKSVNTIAGVAIATALMPPLCTAGFSLATGHWAYFGGAIFLFSINTIFIASATYIVVKFLKFPLKEYADKLRKKRISQGLTFLALLIFLPSVFMFYQLYKKSDFEQKVNGVLLELKEDKGISILDVDSNYKDNIVEFAVLGKSLGKEDIDKIQNKMKKLGYENVSFKVLQDVENKETLSRLSEIENSYLTTQQLLVKKEEQLVNKDKEIYELKTKLNSNMSISFDEVSKEIKSLNSNITSITFYNRISTDFKKIDTIPNFVLKWDAKTKKSEISKETTKYQNWLIQKMKNKKVVVKSE